LERNEAFTLVSGATSEIGSAIARRLAGSRRLLLHGRNESALQELRASLPDPSAHGIWVRDLSDPAAAGADLAARISGQHEFVAEFVHAAGVFAVWPTRSLDMEAVRMMFDVGVFSAIEICSQLVRKRVNQGALANILFISSIASRIGARGYQAYSASKGALNALARSLAVELAPAVRVNCVLPGGIETKATRMLYATPDAAAKANAEVPLGLGSAQDVAALVDFLLSADARWITGQEFVVDGGRSIL